MSSFSVYLSPRINIEAAWAWEEPKPSPACARPFAPSLQVRASSEPPGQRPRPCSLKPPFICQRGEGGGTGPGRWRGGGNGQTDPTDSKEFRETARGRTNHRGPSGPGVRKEKGWAASAARVPARLLARPLLARPGSRPQILLGGGNI